MKPTVFRSGNSYDEGLAFGFSSRTGHLSVHFADLPGPETGPVRLSGSFSRVRLRPDRSGEGRGAHAFSTEDQSGAHLDLLVC